MEIKHTVEILTKDIQEIEKLIANLNNSPTPHRIDLDLTLAKLRNVYELVSLIAEDVKADQKGALETDAGSTESRETEMPQQVQEEVPHTPAESVSEETNHVPHIEEAPVVEKAAPVASGTQSVTSPEAIAKPAVSEAPEIPVVEQKEQQIEFPTEPEPDATAKKPAEEKPVIKEAAEEKREEAAPKSPGILAEKFASNRSINDNIAPKGQKDLSTKLSGEPIESISRNIGINDRFQIIRELLEGSNEIYTQLIKQLDACSGFVEAYELLESNFPDNMEHPGVQILISLARRKYISPENA